MSEDVTVVRQCKSCPWRLDTTVDSIPSYVRQKHAKLKCTIAKNLQLGSQLLHVMTCHYKEGEVLTDICAGYAENQLGPGNNLALRMRLMGEKIKFETEGEQVRNFRDTFK